MNNYIKGHMCRVIFIILLGCIIHSLSITSRTHQKLSIYMQPDTSMPATREQQLEKRQRKIKRKLEMPLSQKWYKAKQQHLSKNQKRALRELWPIYGIDLKYNTSLDLPSAFLSSADINLRSDDYYVLDVGFGLGESLVGMAENNSNKYYLGCEIHKAGLASALQKTNGSALINVKVVRCDATVLLESHLPENSLNEICVFFPDPWLNVERDENRRIIRPHMIGNMWRALKGGGMLRIATDVSEYADNVRMVMNSPSVKSFWSCHGDSCFPPCERAGRNLLPRPVTKYEHRAQELKNLIWEYEYCKII